MIEVRRTVEIPPPFDLVRTVRAYHHGSDPALRIDGGVVWRATRTPEGPVTQRLVRCSTGVEVTAWGPGAEWGVEQVPDLLGVHDVPWVPEHDGLRRLSLRVPGVRIGRTHRVVEGLLPILIGQKVTTAGAHRSWRELVWRFGERAPGPVDKLWVPPDPQVLRAQPYHALHPLGLERHRAELIGRVCHHARRIEEVADMPFDDGERRLRAIRGIGPWTTGSLRGTILGDADAVPVGDYHLPNSVAWALAGEVRGDDARMLELLEPFRPHRQRVIRLLEQSGAKAPRFGPRTDVRDIRDQ